MRLSLTLLVLVASAALAPAAPVPKAILKKFPDYYPLLPGTEWEYEAGESLFTVKVKDYEKKDGVRTGTLATFSGENEVATERIRVDAKGVSRTHINGIEIEPPVLILKFGIGDETAWDTKAKVGKDTVDFTFKLEGLEEAKVPAGKYKAVKVTGSGDIAGTKSRVVYHFAEGVGIVRLSYGVGGGGATMQLKKFTPGKEE